MSPDPVPPARSIIIPVLDFSDHSEYSILTLLDDLAGVEGEVICVFNSPEVFERLRDHDRITRFCYNSQNAGVARAWNMGINLAEGRALHVMNSDLHVLPGAIPELEKWLFSLEKAVMAGPQGSILDFKQMKPQLYFQKGQFDKPVRTHDVSGFWFCLNHELFLKHKLTFDVRYSPCQFEEWDMGLQVIQAGLACYTVPVQGFEHHWGVSAAKGDRIINYFGREVILGQVYAENRRKFQEKWGELFNRL